MALVFLLAACCKATPQPPEEPEVVTTAGPPPRATNKVALYFDNTRNTRGLVFGVENSSFVKTVDQIYDTMYNGWTGLFYALSAQLQYVPFQEAVSSREWKAGAPKNFKQAYKLQEFYDFSVFAKGRGPLQRLVEDTQVDDSLYYPPTNL